MTNPNAGPTALRWPISQLGPANGIATDEFAQGQHHIM